MYRCTRLTGCARLARVLAPSGAILLWLTGHCAWAQGAPAAEPTESALAEVIVTAQKRSENAQKVPISMSVLSGDQTLSAGAVTAVDLNSLVPGMQVVSSGPFAMTSIRGIGTQQVNAFRDPVVGYNVDGVIQDRSINATAAFYDIERIEVLKGPQGTLYGRNATAGAINIITNKPTNSFGGNLQVDVGNYSSLKTTGALNTPISDTLSARFAFQTIKHNGYFSDGQNDADDVAGRVHVLYTPSDKVSLLLTADGLRQGGRGPEDEPLPYGSGGQSSSDPWNQHYYHNTTGNAFPQSAYLINPYQDNHFWGVQAQLDWDLGPATLTVIPAYRYSNQDMDFNYDGVYEIVHNPTHQSTGEIRLGHAGDNTAGSMSWVGGLYYFRLTQTDLSLYGLPCLCANDASPVYIKSPNNVGRDLSDLNSRSYAAFGQMTYSFSDWLRATVGGRYTHDQKTENGIGLVYLYAQGIVFSFPDVGEESWQNFSWRLGLDADISAHSLVYANISTGYKAGGLNEGLNATPYAPEKLTAFAVGSKNRLLANHLLLNSELFYWRYADHQVATVASINPPPNVGYIGVNIPNSRVYGADVDASYAMATGTHLDLSAEYLNGSTGAYRVPTTSAVDFVTNEAPMISSPRWNFTLSLRQDWTVGTGTVSAEARVHRTTRQLLYPIESPDAYAPSTSVGDLDLTYSAAQDRWYVRAYIKNIGNEATLLSVFPGLTARDFSGPDPFRDVRQYGFIGAPRTYGVHVGARF